MSTNDPYEEGLQPAEYIIKTILNSANAWTPMMIGMLYNLKSVKGRTSWRYRSVTNAQSRLLRKRISPANMLRIDRGGASQLLSMVFVRR